MFRPFIIAVQFLTRLPTPRLNNISQQEIGHSLAWYPLVGLIIGGILVGALELLSNAPINLQAALILSLWVLITGALHLDGLADSADAWLGGHGDKDKTLAIMKDPTSGPAAVVILILILLIKYTAIEAIITHDDWLILLFAPMLARGMMLLLFQTTTYVRTGGLGEALAHHHSHLTGWMLIAALTIACIWILALQGIIILLSSCAIFLFIRHMMKKRVGGTTGDTAGALIEISEAVILLSIALSQ